MAKAPGGLEGLNTISFEDLGDKTRITVHAALTRLDPKYSFAAEGMNEGWNQSLDKLNDYINLIKN